MDAYLYLTLELSKGARKIAIFLICDWENRLILGLNAEKK